VVIQCASASGPFMNALAGPGRVIITASARLRAQRHALRQLSRARHRRPGGRLGQGRPDLAAGGYRRGAGNAAFYKEQGRMMTEHACWMTTATARHAGGMVSRHARGEIRANGKSIDGIRAHQVFLVPGEQEKQLPGKSAHAGMN